MMRSASTSIAAASRRAAWLACALPLCIAGCSSPPPLTRTGFLSDYSTLESVSNTRMRYISPELKNYRSFIVDPIEFRLQKHVLDAQDRAEVAEYFREALINVLKGSGYTITSTQGEGVARLRIAITNISEGTWWMKIHPASSLAGAGRGGASMEAEVIDSVTGDQLGAFVAAGVGSQLTAFHYTTLSDIKSTIDEWAKNAGIRLDELRNAK